MPLYPWTIGRQCAMECSIAVVCWRSKAPALPGLGTGTSASDAPAGRVFTQRSMGSACKVKSAPGVGGDANSPSIRPLTASAAAQVRLGARPSTSRCRPIPASMATPSIARSPKRDGTRMKLNPGSAYRCGHRLSGPPVIISTDTTVSARK